MFNLNLAFALLNTLRIQGLSTAQRILFLTLFLFSAGLSRAEESSFVTTQPAPCEVQWEDQKIQGRACVDFYKKTFVSLCNKKVCTVSDPKKLVRYGTKVSCLNAPVIAISELEYKYPMEVFMDWLSPQIPSKYTNATQIIRYLKNNPSEILSLKFRNAKKLNDFLLELNKKSSLKQLSLHTLKTDYYPKGTQYFQKNKDGFKEIKLESDLIWPECNSTD